MSKVIKQMQMNVLKNDFKDVRDLVVLNVVGLSAINTNSIRLALRKKGIRLQVVKNSLARRNKSKSYFVRGVLASRSAMRSSSAQTSAIRPEIIRRPACAGACPVSSTRTTRSGMRLAAAARIGRAGSPTLTRPGAGCKAMATESRMPDVARRQLVSPRLKNA